MYDRRGEISGWKDRKDGKEKCAQWAQRGEKRNLPPRGFKTRCLRRRTLHLQLEDTRLVVEMHRRRTRMVCGRKMRQHPAGTPMAFPWTASVGLGSGGDYRVKRLLQRKKRAKEKTTQNTRREVSDERKGDEDNGTNAQHVPPKNNGGKEESRGTATSRRRR
ncbi:hypothetical protein K438DRAFT_1777472 [Mycena galopus ATCC 62051]|nr:hypothetical protein K438DRAFT_1777472 [Mycena galopus ATCC 62051]